MRKQELIHLHALFDCIRNELPSDGTGQTNAFAEYEAVGVRQPHIHAQKAAHEEAIRLLLVGIERTIERQSSREILQPVQLPQM